ncbi:MAG: hypothetical protein ACRDAX_10000 [Propionibacteriaceae bacterium]
MQAIPVDSPDIIGEIYDYIIRPSFRHRERVSRRMFLHYYAQGIFDTVYVRTTKDRPGAVVIGEHDPVSNIMLITWLAASPEARSEGLGSKVFSLALDSWKDRSRMILGEIEHPAIGTKGTHGDPRARVRFYSRFNGQVLDIPYFQPRTAPWLPRASQMMLTVFYDSQPREDGLVEAAPVRTWMRERMKHEFRDSHYRRAFAAVAGETIATTPIGADPQLLPSDGGLRFRKLRKHS